MSVVWLFFQNSEKEEATMAKDNKFATNKGGVIKAPKPVSKDSPKSIVVKSNDLRNGKKNSK